MQRRAAAIYAAFFIVLAAGAFSVTAVTAEPDVSLNAPVYQQGDTFDVGGTTYTVSTVSDSSAEITWTNETARYTDSWEVTTRSFTGTPEEYATGDGPTVTVGETEFRVITRDVASPEAFYLVEYQAIGENTTTTEVNGTTYVVVEDGDDQSFVELDRYLIDEFGEPAVQEYTVGDSFEYDNQTVTVTAVSNSSVTFEWTAPRQNTISAGSEGANVTIGGQTYVAHFPQPDRLQLTSNHQAYQQEMAVIDTYNERMNGFWGITIIGGSAAVLLIALAYLPSRY
ncbi:MAG: hypothetical protein SVG88_07120 [Halobacteriales archaeon]|nr:hypothetical protein [Halobacteriales archaeon]